MSLHVALFWLLQALAPLLAMAVAYSFAYRKRLQGVSGNELENDLNRMGFWLAGLTSFVFFWAWPEGSQSWSRMPGFESLCAALLGDSPQQDPDYSAVKAMVSLVVAFLAGLLARFSAFRLNRVLVRQVPRYFRPDNLVGKS